MKDSNGRVGTGAVLAVAVVAVLTAWFAHDRRGGAPKPGEAIAQQSMVTAPPLAMSTETSPSTTMGGPPSPAHATR